jgi:serine/threonine protein kinase
MKITLDSFLAVLKRSGLIPLDRLQSQLDKFQKQQPDAAADAKPFADLLVAEGVLTDWQCEKLLQGKHKGFFLGKYRLLRLLGKGGMSSVYLAEHVLMRRRCAIKVLPAKRVNDTSYLGRFHREAQAVAALDHPNIVRAYDVDHEQDGNVEIHFLVMEYVDGASLFDKINRDGRLTPVAAAEFIRQAAHGLEHAHRAGLIHRDIKPGNLLVDNSGVVKVMDLGLARFFAGQDEESLTIQYDEKVLGTADYLAPEQAVDSHDIDARADVYSLGCTLYFLLTGHPPFNQGTLPQRLMAHQTKEPPPVTAERQDVPESLLAILKKMMAKQTAERYQSAAETAEAMTGWLRQHGGEAWSAMRSKLADSGVDVASGSGPQAVVTPALPAIATPARTKEPERKPAAKKPAPAAKSDSTPRTAAPATAAPANEDAALGAFLSNLSVNTGPTAPVTAKPADSGDRTPAITPRKTEAPPAHKPREAIPVAKPVEAPPVVRPAVAVPVERIAVAEAVIAEAVAEPVEAVPVAEAIPTATAVPLSTRRTSKNQKPLIYALAGGAGLLLLIVLIVAFSGGDDATGNPGATTNGTQAGTGAHSGGTTPVDVGPRRPVPESPREVTVGPEGNFATIAEALQYAKENQPLTDSREPRLIRVKGGAVYAERIDLRDWNLGMLHILSDGPERAILRPEGIAPIISLNNCSMTRIEGFTLDAAEKPVAVELEGTMPEVQLANLRITGFTQIGIDGDQAKGLGGRWLELRDLSLTPASESAIGIRLVDTGFGLEKITIAGNRLIGPLEAGIHLGGTLREVHIRQNRLHNLKTPVRFESSGQQFELVRIENNTFHRVARGLLFASSPASGRQNFFINNLFVDVSGPEIEFATTPDPQLPAALAADGQIVFNWTTRPAEAVASLAWNIFADRGQAGVAPPAFVSTDPESGEFLKPVGDQLRSPESPSNEKFIGAVSP